MKIEINKEDYEFLKDLQHELLTQENDGNADPVFWGVMEKKEVSVPDGCGDCSKIVYDVDELCRFTGAFITKRACKEYVEKYAYNHSQPRTYAMTAYRNFELERLLNILKTIDLKDEE